MMTSLEMSILSGDKGCPPIIFHSLTAILSLLLIFSAGCKKTEDVRITELENHPVYKNYKFSDDEKVIDIGVTTPVGSVSHIVEVMKRDEIFGKELEKMGYKVRFYPFMKCDDVNYFMRKGILKGAIIGDMPALVIASEGRIKIMSVFNRGSVSLISRDIYRIKDLKGKKVAYPNASIAHYYLLKVLNENGMSENDVIHKPMDTENMLDTLKNKKVDTFAIFEPGTAIYKRLDPTLHEIHRSFSGYRFFAMRKDYEERHKDVVRIIIAAQIRAVMWLKESDRNMDRASRWMAEESMKMFRIPFNKYIKELNNVCTEDIVADINVYSAVISEDETRDGRSLSSGFEFLKTKGFISKDKKWDSVRNYFDTDTALDVIKHMKVRPATVTSEHF